MNGITSPESGNNTQRRNPLEEIRDVMEGKRANKIKKCDPGLLQRVQDIMQDFINTIKKAMPAAPTERPGVTPR